MSLSTTIKSIQDIMRKDVGVDGDAQRIAQLTWLLFLKIWDDREQELELIEPGFRSPLVEVVWRDAAGATQTAEDLRWRTWAADPEGLTGESLLAFVEGTLFSALKGLEVGPAVDEVGERGSPAALLRQRRLLLRGVFEDAYQYMKSGTLLRQVVNRLQVDIDFNDARKRHLFGEIYEQVLRDLQSAGNAGEYYTPRAVTQFAVEMIDPKLGEIVLDPACGTGGFLTGAIEHVRQRGVRTSDDERLLQASIRGVEKKPLPHLLSVTNMVVHGIDVPTGIQHTNTLARPVRDITSRDRVDVLLTNPPFGGVEEDGIENNFPADYRTRETADLFLLLIIELLKPTGRAAVVLPNGTLFGEDVKTRIKRRLLSECNLHTIVRLPRGVFAPYTNIETNILFFDKGRPTKEIWYYEHEIPGGGRYSKTRGMKIDEFAPEKSWWHDRRETDRAWCVSIDEVEARGFNLDIGNPRTRRFATEEPATALSGIDASEIAASDLRNQLREFLLGCGGATVQDWSPIITRIHELVRDPADVDIVRRVLFRLALDGRLGLGDPTDGDAATQLGPRVLPQLAASSLPALPPRWAWSCLSRLGEVVGGGTPPKANLDYWRGATPWVSPKDMKSSQIRDTVDHVSDDAILKSPLRPVPAGSLLMVVRGMILAHTFPTAVTEVPVTINQDMKALVPFRPGLAPYLDVALRAARSRILGLVQRSTHGTCKLPTDHLLALPLAIPPESEMSRLVTRVSEVAALADQLESVLRGQQVQRAAFREAMIRRT